MNTQTLPDPGLACNSNTPSGGASAPLWRRAASGLNRLLRRLIESLAPPTTLTPTNTSPCRRRPFDSEDAGTRELVENILDKLAEAHQWPEPQRTLETLRHERQLLLDEIARQGQPSS